jgi:hypothetical protein
MKIIVAIILTALLSFVAGLYLPWWSVAIAAFFVALIIPQFPWKGFLSGFLGVFILWAVIAWWIDMKNQGILSSKIAVLFHLGSSHIVMIFVSALIGALIGGFAALSGSYLRTK